MLLVLVLKTVKGLLIAGTLARLSKLVDVDA
jgi:hypothetical protein